MIKEIFSPDDASAILSIPLSMRLPADWMVWAYSPKGNFAIKSAYRLAVAAGSVGSTGGLSNVQNQKKKNLEKFVAASNSKQGQVICLES